jgi:hypothetical protein
LYVLHVFDSEQQDHFLACNGTRQSRPLKNATEKIGPSSAALARLQSSLGKGESVFLTLRKWMHSLAKNARKLVFLIKNVHEKTALPLAGNTCSPIFADST